MTDDRSIDRALERAARSWIEEGPTRAPDRPVDAALSRIQTTNQERDLRILWRLPTMNPVRSPRGRGRGGGPRDRGCRADASARRKRRGASAQPVTNDRAIAVAKRRAKRHISPSRPSRLRHPHHRR